MHIQTNRETLLPLLTSVAGVTEKRQTLPILSNVLVKLTDQQLTLTTTDVEIEVFTTAGPVTGNPGAATIPAKKFLDICKALPQGAEIEIRLEKEKVTIRSGRSRFTLQTLPVIDFPALETSEWKFQFEIQQKLLKKLLEKTHFCMAHQDVRYYLNGLLLEVHEAGVRAVATDGHRMALSESRQEMNVTERLQIIVPRKGVQEILRFIGGDGPATVKVGTNHVCVDIGHIVFTSKLIDGQYPDYRRVIPENQNKRILADKESLRSALGRAAILANEKFKGVHLMARPGVIQIVAHNPDQEEAVEEIAVDYNGDEIDVGFNASYLIEAASNVESDQVELNLRDSDSGCIIQEPNSDQLLYVVMPMRL